MKNVPQQMQVLHRPVGCRCCVALLVCIRRAIVARDRNTTLPKDLDLIPLWGNGIISGITRRTSSTSMVQ